MKPLGSTMALVFIGLSLLAGNAGAQTVTILHSFISSTDGGGPVAGLIQASDGNFYGITSGGGIYSGGTAFRITPDGVFTNLHSFTSPWNGGFTQWAPLVQGRDGYFYGTTISGGNTNLFNGEGGGTVFRMDTNGVLTNLYSFNGAPSDGAGPFGPLLQGPDGNFYGTANVGGPSKNCNVGCGAIFRITPSGILTNLHFFNGTDGANCHSGLLLDSDGNFYGTTGEGNGGTGSFFEITPQGAFINLPIHWVGFSGSREFLSGFARGTDGNFYGTAYEGGRSNYGAVYRYSPLTGVSTNIHSFDNINGSLPYAGLVQGSDGNFYGATEFLVSSGGGTVFQISSSGSFTTLYVFTNSPSAGANLLGTLVQGSDGNFYGTSKEGGAYGAGTIFKLTIPLIPPANQISALQANGNDMYLSVPSVAGETYQLQFTTDPTSDNWTNIAGVTVSNSIGALMTLTNFGGALLPQGFYRFDITP